jgi:hypothetical protein
MHLSLCTRLSLMDRKERPAGRGQPVSRFARTACVARSGASPNRFWAPHTWLSPAASKPYPSLPPFALCAAFPRSDYYGGSAPRPRHRQTCRLAGLRVPGARIGVPMFTGETRGAVGGRLYPWQRRPHAKSGRGGGVPMPGTPSRAEIATERRLHARRRRVFAPYRGFHHRLQQRVAPPCFTLAPSVARLRSRCSFAGSLDRSAVAGPGTVPGGVRGPLLHPARPGRG